MKKLTALLLALVMVFALAACGDSSTATTATPAPTEEVTESAEPTENGDATADFTTVEAGKLIMSTNAAFPPYEMTDDNGNVVGIDPEIAAAIAEKLGLELVIDDMDFTAALEAVQGGRADMAMAGITVNEDRLAVMDFTDTYATGVQVVIVPEDSDMTSPDDLPGKLIGTQMGTTGWQFCVDEFGEDAVVPFDDAIIAVQNLLNGQVDCVVIDNAPAQSLVEANQGLRILETPWVEEDYAIGVAKNNTALLDAINTALDELTADGTVQSIIDKYISAEG